MRETRKFFEEALEDLLMSYDMDEDVDFRKLSTNNLEGVLGEFEDSLEIAFNEGWEFDELHCQLMDDAYEYMGEDSLLDSIIRKGLSILLEEVKNLF